jgi:hypothetical protein
VPATPISSMVDLHNARPHGAVPHCRRTGRQAQWSEKGDGGDQGAIDPGGLDTS